MCSIAGVTAFDSGQLVDSLLELMRHRAPDDKGVIGRKHISWYGKIKNYRFILEKLVSIYKQR